MADDESYADSQKRTAYDNHFNRIAKERREVGSHHQKSSEQNNHATEHMKSRNCAGRILPTGMARINKRQV